eukprot:CFRG0625T1
MSIGDNTYVLPAREHAEEFYAQYDLGEIIGYGTAVVRHCTRIETGEDFAVKIIDKSEDPESNKHIISEIGFLNTLGYHPNIIRLYDSYDTEGHFFLVFELAKTGELFELLTEKVFVSEDIARNMMRQILAGVEHIHAHNVVHRDLKLENILMMEENSLKISDFGFAASVHDAPLTELCGTPGYLSPEMIRAALNKSDESNQGYTYPVDMWGCGVILYTLLVGFPPFWHSNRMVLMRLIMRGKFEFLSPYWDSVSEEAKDLVSKLLAADPTERLTASQAITHPWLVSSCTSTAPPVAPRVHNRMKIVALAVMAINRFKYNVQTTAQREPEKDVVKQPVVVKEDEEPSLAAQAQAMYGMSASRTYNLSVANYPVSVTDSMYKEPRVRKAIDECAFRIYAHWVKKSNAQNRAALFENYLVRHTT